MNMVSAISLDGGAAVRVVDSTGIAAEMRRLHGTSATASAALGRLLTAAALMGGMQKSGELTIRIDGGGPIGVVTAICAADGTVRGCCGNPRADRPLNPATGKLDVGGIVGKNGTLAVIRKPEAGASYSGQSRLISGEIAEDITAYFAVSEQTPTVCALGVLVDTDLSIRAAGGYIAQLMPGASDHEAEAIERNAARMEAVSSMIDAGKTPEDIALAVLDGLSPRILGSARAGYSCKCSREKMERALASLRKSDLEELADEAPETEIVCSFCNRKYIFVPEELRSLAAEL
jgi:molecular chaperone Hsp33